MNQQRPFAFDYQEPRYFLKDYLAYKKLRKHSYSLRTFARDLGCKSPSYLSEVINGKRNLTPSFIQKLDDLIQLNKDEKQYFIYQLLRSGDARESLSEPPEKDVFLGMRLNHIKVFDADLEILQVIKEWYHITIMEMTEIADFKADSDWISKKLGGKIAPFQVDLAIMRMKKLGLLIEKDGRLVKTHNDVFFGKNIASHAIQQLHKNSLSLAQKSLEHDPILEREFTGTTIPINKHNFSKIKKLISDFNLDLHRLAQGIGEATDVYQINVQAFCLTQSEEKNIDKAM